MEVKTATREAGSDRSDNHEISVINLYNDSAELNTSQSTQEDKESRVYITGTKLLALVGSVTLIAFLLLLDQSILSTAIPEITSNFHSLPDVGWYVGVYPLASASLQPLTGKFYTYFRAKWTFLVFLSVFEIGSVICGSATSSVILIVGRAISGLGASGLINGALTVIAGSTPLEKRPLYTGIMLGISSLGIVMGPLIGGALTEYASWRWCFYINLPMGGAAAGFLCLIQVPDLTEKKKFSMALVREVIPELDLFGFVLLTPAAIMFLLALQFGSEESYAWDSAVIIGLFGGAGVTAILFGLWERHMGDRAMIPGSLVKQRIVWMSGGLNLCFMSGLVVSANYLPVYFQAVKGVSPTISGVYVLPTIISQLLTAGIAGAAVSRWGYYLPWAVASGVVATVGYGLISTFSTTTAMATIIGFQILLGCGRGAGMQVAVIAVQNAVKAEQIPVALAFLVFAQNMGASVFAVIATTLFTQSLVADLKKNAPSVSPKAALAAGGSASAVRALVPPNSGELKAVLDSFSDSVSNVFYLMVGLALASFIFAWGTGWKDIRKKKTANEQDSQSDEKATV